MNRQPDKTSKLNEKHLLTFYIERPTDMIGNNPQILPIEIFNKKIFERPRSPWIKIISSRKRVIGVRLHQRAQATRGFCDLLIIAKAESKTEPAFFGKIGNQARKIWQTRR